MLKNDDLLFFLFFAAIQGQNCFYGNLNDLCDIKDFIQAFLNSIHINM